MRVVRQLAGFAALAALAVAGGWAVSAYRAGGAPAADPADTGPVATAPLTVEAAVPTVSVDPLAAVPNADALPADAGAIEGLESVLLMAPGTPRSLPPGALFEGDELVEERYLLAWELNGQRVDVFRYLKRNAGSGPGTYLCFATAIGDRAGGGSCSLLGGPLDPAKPGSRPTGEENFVNKLILGSGAGYVLQAPVGTTHVVVTLQPVGASSPERRLALIPHDGIAMIVIPGSTQEMGVEFTAWDGPTLLASGRA